MVCASLCPFILRYSSRCIGISEIEEFLEYYPSRAELQIAFPRRVIGQHAPIHCRSPRSDRNCIASLPSPLKPSPIGFDHAAVPLRLCICDADYHEHNQTKRNSPEREGMSSRERRSRLQHEQPGAALICSFCSRGMTFLRVLSQVSMACHPVACLRRPWTNVASATFLFPTPLTLYPTTGPCYCVALP